MRLEYLRIHLALLSLFLFFLPLFFGRACLAHPLTQGAIELSATELSAAEHSPSAGNSKTCRINLLLKAALEQVTVEQTAHLESLASADAQLLESQPIERLWSRHADYLLQHIQITAEERALTLTQDKDRQILRTGALVEFPMVATFDAGTNEPQSACPKEIVIFQDILREVLFAPGNPWESSYVVTVVRDGASAHGPYLLTSGAPLKISLAPAASGSALSLAVSFLEHGIWHILEGYDHLLFASALALSTFLLWDVVRILAAFTLAHTITLTLAALGLVHIPSHIVEPLIAFSIMAAALVNLLPQRGRSSFTRSLYVAFFFGLFHGLGFAGGLVESMQGLPSKDFWTAIVGFSVGVEIGHQAIVMPLLLLTYLIRRVDIANAWNVTPRLVKTLSLLIGAGGLYFFVGALESAL